MIWYLGNIEDEIKINFINRWRPKSIKQKRHGHKEVPIIFDYEEFLPLECEVAETLVYKGYRVKNSREMITHMLPK